MQLAEPLLTVVGYISMTELGWISAIVSRETDDSVAVKLEEEEDHYPLGTQRTEISGGLNISEKLGRDSRCLNLDYSTLQYYEGMLCNSGVPLTG